MDRVDELIKQQVSEILLREINFQDMLVTVTGAKTSADLRNAKILISVIPDSQKELALEIINKNIYHLQQELNGKIEIKYVPKIRFEIDKLEEKAQGLEKIFTKNKA